MAHIRPIDIYEISWALNSFRAADVIEPDDPVVRRLLDRLWTAWNPQFGVSFSSYSGVYDVDCTAATFALLKASQEK